MSTTTVRRDLRALPKAELHLHLLGAMRAATLSELAAEAGLTAPDPRGFTTFAEFQLVFQAAFKVTLTRPQNRRPGPHVARHQRRPRSAHPGRDGPDRLLASRPRRRLTPAAPDPGLEAASHTRPGAHPAPRWCPRI